eukprot:Colp12_sorted_trinity150504_noHs@12758
MASKATVVLLLALCCSFAKSQNCPTGVFPSTCGGIPNLSCPINWKRGVAQGNLVSGDVFDITFMQCLYSYSLCGQLSVDQGCQALPTSGVIVGTGLNLNSYSYEFLLASGTPSSIIDKIRPVLGKLGADAQSLLTIAPINLSDDEALTLSRNVLGAIARQLEAEYNNKKASGAAVYANLPKGVRTAMLSIYYQFGSIAELSLPLWQEILANNWQNAINILTGITIDPLKRRAEADIIAASNQACTNNIDVVFVIDESGSIGDENFARVKDFVYSIVNSFGAIGPTGTQVGLVTYSDKIGTTINLNTYGSKDTLLAAIQGLSYSRGGTGTGAAIQYSINNIYQEAKGLRSETSGVPRVMVVVTDGQSQDDVRPAAMAARGRGINVFTVGVGQANSTELGFIASAPTSTHVTLLGNFTDLPGTRPASSLLLS